MRMLKMRNLIYGIEKTKSFAAANELRRDQRGGVALMTAMSFIVILMCAGLSIDVSNWSLVKQELQRTVDLAAFAGAASFSSSNDAMGAANIAANLAELNGASGSTSRTWNAGTMTLSDGQVNVQVSKGIRNSKNTAFQVIITQPAPVTFAKIFQSADIITVGATGWAETRVNVQPCIFAMDIAGAGVSAVGTASLAVTGCSVRSNASIATVGSASMSAQAFYANGLITGSETGGPLVPNDGTIPDPYANYSPVQTALNRLMPGYGSSFSNMPNSTSSLSAGDWSRWDIKGAVTLDAGIYYIHGPISIGAQGSLSGTGVTIVTSGSLVMVGGASLTLSAAKIVDAVHGAIPGVVFAGNSTGPSSFAGNTSPSLTGVIYYPKGAIDFGGTAQGGSSGCLQAISSSIAFRGTSSLASNCAGYGTLGFNSDSAVAGTLVQ